jgi:bacillithiol synthase
VEDYRAGRGPATAFFAGRPDEPGAWARKLAEVSGRFDRAARERAAAALHPTTAAAAARLARFVEEGGAMVTTGQQTGLFTGPLYTLHKVLTAVRLAATLERFLGVTVLPVFWAATEDHDFEEVSRTRTVDGEGNLRLWSIARTDPRPLSMSEMRLGRDVCKVSGELVQSIANTAYDAEYLRWILEPYRPGSSVAAAFLGSIARVLEGFDLLLADAAAPSLKEASVPVLVAELEASESHERLLAERTDALAAAGYAAQVTLVPGSPNVFVHGPAGRERLVRERDGWRAPAGRLRLRRSDLASRVRGDAGSFSPNVLLRPVVESAVFPTLAYVGGPAEIAYLAQAGALFAAHGILPPVAFPRFSVRVVPEEVAADAAVLGLTDAELARPHAELASRLAAERLPAPVAGALRALRDGIVRDYAALLDAAAGTGPDLERALGARRNRALLEAARAERTLLADLKRRDPLIAGVLPRVRNHLMPLGEPQERVLNALPYLAMRRTLLSDLAAVMEPVIGAVAAEGREPSRGPLRAPAASDAADPGG